MDFSIMFFGSTTSQEIEYDVLMKIAEYADKNSFSAIWTPERHFGDFGAAFPSPSVLGAALAAVTENIDIRSGSVVLPLRDPIRVAEEWALVDRLSKGRIGLSIASGWRADDFVFYGSDYQNRHLQMKERITELKKIWNGEPILRKNGEGKDFTVKIRPEPITKNLPLWITASGRPETFEYAGKIGANLLTHMLKQSLENLEESIAIYHKALKENGFDISERKVTLMLHTYMDASEEEAKAISEEPFKKYLRTSIELIKPKDPLKAKHFNVEELVDMSYAKYDSSNTLIGSAESCQEMLQKIESIGITEVACLVDFGVENDKVLSGMKRIVEAKDLYNLARLYQEF